MNKIIWVDESLSAARKILHKGIKDINNTEKNKNELIHDSRKRVKNLRAILKLIQSELNENKFKLLNNKLKALNKKSAVSRRAFVLLNIIDKMLFESSNNVSVDLLKTLKDNMLEIIESSQPKYNINQILSSYHDTFVKIDEHLSELKFERKDFSAIRNGLALMYDEGKKFYKISARQQEVIILHELRKSAKDLYYVLEIFQKCWQPVIKPYNNQIKILTDYIGDLHDLHEFMLELNNPLLKNYKSAKDNLKLIIDNQISSQKRQILILAEKIYAEKTNCFINRIEKIAKFESA